MLESFLNEPDLLSDAQVMEILEIAFRQTEVQEALEKMLKTFDLEGS